MGEGTAEAAGEGGRRLAEGMGGVAGEGGVISGEGMGGAAVASPPPPPPPPLPQLATFTPSVTWAPPPRVTPPQRLSSLLAWEARGPVGCPGESSTAAKSSRLSDVMRGFIYDTKSIMFDQHLVLSALSNVGIFISICGQLKKVTNKR